MIYLRQLENRLSMNVSPRHAGLVMVRLGQAWAH
jgi:hypothetical protein